MTYQALLSNGENILIPVIDEDYPSDYVWGIIEEVFYMLNDDTTTILEIKPSH